MKAIQLEEPKHFRTIDIPEPPSGAVRIKIQACGICHSDSVTKEGLFPNIQYPRVPGHEVAGVIDAVGENVQGWKTGQRVGVVTVPALGEGQLELELGGEQNNRLALGPGGEQREIGLAQDQFLGAELGRVGDPGVGDGDVESAMALERVLHEAFEMGIVAVRS